MSTQHIIRRAKKRRAETNRLVGILCIAQKQRYQALIKILEMEELEQEDRNEWGGRRPGAKNRRRGESNWNKDYTADESTYPPYVFRRRFSVPKVMFNRLKKDLLEYNYDVWKQRTTGYGKKGIPTDIKILASLRILSSGCPYDSLDDVAYMSEQTVKIYFYHFCIDVVAIYGTRFINRMPKREELDDITDKYKTVGFPGCIGAIDCMKIKWSKCPVQDKGQYLNTNDSKLATIQCEAWCDHDLYCWHWHPGRVGTNNDITVLYRSPLFRKILHGDFKMKSETSYEIGCDGDTRMMYYFLVDGIYPGWPIFAKPIHQSTSTKESNYSVRQEAVRKDVERLFGVLQTRFEILRREMRKWDFNELVRITNVCIILHNMIVRMQQNGDFEEEAQGVDVVTELLEEEEQMRGNSFMEFVENRAESESQRCADPTDEAERLIMT